MNNKYSLQFEDGEQTQMYKVPDVHYLKNFNEIQSMVDGAFLNEVDKIFMMMSTAKKNAVDQLVSRSVEDEFDQII